MKKIDIEGLKTFRALESIPDRQLYWLIERSEHLVLSDGDLLSKPGEAFSGTHFIISGSCLAYSSQNGNHREIATINAGEITGYLPYSRARESTVCVSATGKVQIMLLPCDRMREMILENFELTQALVNVMSNRIKYITSLQLQNEKMMALGKLSAGMSHELNNPASANVRDSSFLVSSLCKLPQLIADLNENGLQRSQLDLVFEFLTNMVSQTDFLPPLGLIEKIRLEDAVLNWMEDREIENSDLLSESFAAFGVGITELNLLYANSSKPAISRLLNWMHMIMEMLSTAKNIQESSRRISELVTSVKNYTHMDRGRDRHSTDVHTGINNTLIMLEHKIRAGKIKVLLDFDPKMPQIKCFVGELNQVWTNLIDNALDSMRTNGSGILRIVSEIDKEFIKIHVIDDGPGIPEDIIPMIFDPFFTTKDIGLGTGIGLDLVRGIIGQHKGKITVSSRPGYTGFVVCLPINITL